MSAARRVFRLLLLLYPPAYRAQFGSEMIELFELRMMASDNRGGVLASEMAGLLAGAIREWFDPPAEVRHVVADLDGRYLPKAVVTARLRVDDAVQKMVHAISHHQFEQARRLAIEERTERENLRRLCEDYGIDAI